MKKKSLSILIFMGMILITVACSAKQDTESAVLPEEKAKPQMSMERGDEGIQNEENGNTRSAGKRTAEKNGGADEKADPESRNMELRNSSRGLVLTMELWIENLVPLEKPSLKDYSGYMDAQWSDSSLTYSLTDERTGEIYDLRISYNIYDDREFAVRLWRNSDGAVILLYDSDPQSAAYVNRDVQTFLDTKRDMSYYLGYELPSGMERGTFSYNLGNRGGEVFLCEGKEIAPMGGMLAWDQWKAAGGVMIEQGEEAERMEFTDGKLTGMPIIWNHSELLTQPEPLEDCVAPALLVKMDHDVFTISEENDARHMGQLIPEQYLTARIWYVFFAREGASEMYYVYLNADYYSSEDVKELARSVSFTENAFPE